MGGRRRRTVPRDAVWVVSADDGVDPQVWSQVVRLALDCGSFVVPAESVEHDAAAARISHLPHVLAEALALSGAAGAIWLWAWPPGRSATAPAWPAARRPWCGRCARATGTRADRAGRDAGRPRPGAHRTGRSWHPGRARRARFEARRRYETANAGRSPASNPAPRTGANGCATPDAAAGGCGREHADTAGTSPSCSPRTRCPPPNTSARRSTPSTGCSAPVGETSSRPATTTPRSPPPRGGRGDRRRRLDRPAARHRSGREGQHRRRRDAHALRYRDTRRRTAGRERRRIVARPAGSGRDRRRQDPPARVRVRPDGAINASGPAAHPHDPNLVPGGSSSGSAALVAKGVVPVAIGTDTGCSTRTPASLCGIVVMKPSFDALPRRGRSHCRRRSTTSVCWPPTCSTSRSRGARCPASRTCVPRSPVCGWADCGAPTGTSPIGDRGRRRRRLPCAGGHGRRGTGRRNCPRPSSSSRRTRHHGFRSVRDAPAVVRTAPSCISRPPLHCCRATRPSRRRVPARRPHRRTPSPPGSFPAKRRAGAGRAGHARPPLCVRSPRSRRSRGSGGGPNPVCCACASRSTRSAFRPSRYRHRGWRAIRSASR